MPQHSLSAPQIAKMIDISAVQAFHSKKDVQNLVKSAVDYGFGSIHVLPSWVPYARKLLKNRVETSLGTPVGFPSGGNHPAIKQAEAIRAVEDGVDELDMMINVGKLRSGELRFVLDDITGVVEAVGVPVKVILETHYLTEREIRQVCELCVQAGASYVKTSTGWAETGATLEVIAVLTSCLDGRIGVKAAGGIRDTETVTAMYEMGVRRFGINVNSSMNIVEDVMGMPGGRVEVHC